MLIPMAARGDPLAADFFALKFVELARSGSNRFKALNRYGTSTGADSDNRCSNAEQIAQQ
jgi:hypothetical protein